MIAYKRILTILMILVAVAGTKADNGINSPYSRYGLGILSNQSLGINRQMGGLGYGLRSDSYINILNPASFSKADTLTMLFEAGFTLQDVNFKENGKRVNALNASFDYVAMQFRLCKGLGMSIGFLPYSTVGYSFTSSSKSSDGTISSSTHAGAGGLYQPYAGLGWQPFKGLSIGATASFIYGDIDHEVSTDILNSHTDIDVINAYSATFRSYKLDFGLQYYATIAKKHDIVFGATYSLGHEMNADAVKTKFIADVTTTDTIKSGFKLPHTYGGGFTYCYNKQWKFGADYTFQQWGKATFFGDDETGAGIDRHKVSVGLEYTPNELSNKFHKMISYRGGLYYAQPYTKVNGKNGCDEYGVSAGISLPFMNRNNKYSHAAVHISGQYIHMSPKGGGMIAENYFRLNIGITFNEAWFMKMKVK